MCLLPKSDVINVYESIKSFILYEGIVITGFRIFHSTAAFISNFKVCQTAKSPLLRTELHSYLQHTLNEGQGGWQAFISWQSSAYIKMKHTSQQTDAVNLANHSTSSHGEETMPFLLSTGLKTPHFEWILLLKYLLKLFMEDEKLC